MIHKNITIQNTKNRGKGLFANKEIAKGETILIFEGTPVKAINLPKDIDLGDLFPTSIDSYLIVHEPELLINHSCNPNTGFKDDVTLVSLKDIKQGEEVTFDYSTVGTDGWEMECLCGEDNCRKTIKDYKYLSDEIKKEYKNITPSWVTNV